MLQLTCVFSCRYFSATGQCFYGQNCNYLHVQAAPTVAAALPALPTPNLTPARPAASAPSFVPAAATAAAPANVSVAMNTIPIDPSDPSWGYRPLMSTNSFREEWEARRKVDDPFFFLCLFVLILSEGFSCATARERSSHAGDPGDNWSVSLVCSSRRRHARHNHYVFRISFSCVSCEAPGRRTAVREERTLLLLRWLMIACRYALRALKSFRPVAGNVSLERWRDVRHPAIVSLHQAFWTDQVAVSMHWFSFLID